MGFSGTQLWEKKEEEEIAAFPPFRFILQVLEINLRAPRHKLESVMNAFVLHLHCAPLLLHCKKAAPKTSGD